MDDNHEDYTIHEADNEGVRYEEPYKPKILNSNGGFGLLDSPELLVKQKPESSSNLEVDSTDGYDSSPQLGADGSPMLGLQNLASANFSMESLTDSAIPSPGYSPVTQGFGTNASQYTRNYNRYSRRYSNSSLSNSPVILLANQARANPTTKVRPKSAIFLGDLNNHAIVENEVSEHSKNSNKPSRNSFTLPARTNVFPSVSIAPPPGPSRSASPTRSASPSRASRQYRSKSPIRRPASPSKSYQPFNFQPQEVMLHNNGSNQSLQVKPAHRKGHKYKHSSVSMNLFQELPPPTSISELSFAIPDLHPIPNFKETIASVKPYQKLKLLWSGFHMLFSLIVFLTGSHFKLPSLSTLAHLIFYDSLGSLILVSVEVMSNFEVWNSSSIVWPFGLGRLEVLVGFALSASLIMVGGDLLSHLCEEFIILLVATEGVDDLSVEHLSHHVHGEHGNNANWFVYEVILVATMIITLITSNYILASDRINKMINTNDETTTKSDKIKNGKKLPLLDGSSNDQSKSKELYQKLQCIVSAWTKNPVHLLTLSYSLYLIVIPVLPVSIVSQTKIDLDELATLSIALLLCYTGWKLVKLLGGILLLSYPYSDYDYLALKSKVTDDVLSLDTFKLAYGIEKLFITKVNFQLFIAGIKITMRGGSSDIESQLRFELTRIIRNAVADATGKDGVVEVTVDINRM